MRVNTHCSVACRYCGFSRELHRPAKSIDDGLLSMLLQSLQDYQKGSNRRVLVSWLGGEPLQWPGWITYTRNCREEYGLATSVTTNGLALAKPATRRDALRWFSEITLSIDGFADYHDRVRQTPGMFAKLEKVVQSIRDERRSDQPRLRVNMVLTRDNIDDLLEFSELMSRWGIDELTFNQLGGNDRPEFYPDHRLTPANAEGLTQALPSIRHRIAASSMIVQGSQAYLDRIIATSKNQTIAIDDCAPGTSFLFVDEFGRIGPCSFTASQLELTIQDTVAMGIGGLEHLFRDRLRQRACKSCLDCHATHVFEKFETAS